MHKIFILGPQGSGKGTQSRILADRLGIPALSMGALLREAAAKGGERGVRIAKIQASGRLVSDKDALDVLRERLQQPDAANGYVLDGYPRNEEQYRAYEKFDWPTEVIVLTLPTEIAIARLHSRAQIEQRNDDTPDAIAERLAIFSRDTRPMIDHFAKMGIVHEVDGNGTIEEVAERVWEIFSYGK